MVILANASPADADGEALAARWTIALQPSTAIWLKSGSTKSPTKSLSSSAKMQGRGSREVRVVILSR